MAEFIVTTCELEVYLLLSPILFLPSLPQATQAYCSYTYRGTDWLAGDSAQDLLMLVILPFQTFNF